MVSLQDAGRHVRIAALSTMLRMVNLLIALSFGVHREQLEHRMGLTWPRPFLLRPLERCVSMWSLLSPNLSYFDARFLTMIAVDRREDFCDEGQKSVSFVEEESVVMN